MNDAGTTPKSAGVLSEFGYYTLNDFVRVFSRRKWLILLVTPLVGLLAALIGYFLPNVYRATTVILVDPKKVPESYVSSTVSVDVVERLATLREQILSSSRLGQIINDMGLYPELRRKMSNDELIDFMRKNIDLHVHNTGKSDRGLGAFSISYQSHSPVEAARVANQLASLFIAENIRSREQQAQGTADFLTREVEEAKKSLDQKEKQIQELKTRYISELPASEGTHAQAITSLQIELRAEMDAINRAQQQKGYLQSLASDSPVVVNLDTQDSSEVAGLQVLLTKAQADMDAARKRYGDQYPDVIKKSIEIQNLENRIKEAQAQVKPTAKPAPVRQQNPVLLSQISKLEDEIKKDEARQAELQREISYHQSKLERIPLYEQKMASIMLDYDAARDEYTRLVDRKVAADMSSDLEVRQKAERFVVLDPAQVPEKPEAPNRPLINLAGLVLGLVLALVSAVVLEVTDPTVKTEREAASLVGAQVFGEIPWLQTLREKRLRWAKAVLACAGSTILVSAYVFLFYHTWK
jgi:polysaccharide chain length determinant protein (PEP-CTERM system associated)